MTAKRDEKNDPFESLDTAREFLRRRCDRVATRIIEAGVLAFGEDFDNAIEELCRWSPHSGEVHRLAGKVVDGNATLEDKREISDEHTAALVDHRQVGFLLGLAVGQRVNLKGGVQ